MANFTRTYALPTDALMITRTLLLQFLLICSTLASAQFSQEDTYSLLGKVIDERLDGWRSSRDTLRFSLSPYRIDSIRKPKPIYGAEQADTITLWDAHLITKRKHLIEAPEGSIKGEHHYIIVSLPYYSKDRKTAGIIVSYRDGEWGGGRNWLIYRKHFGKWRLKKKMNINFYC